MRPAYYAILPRRGLTSKRPGKGLRHAPQSASRGLVENKDKGGDTIVSSSKHGRDSRVSTQPQQDELFLFCSILGKRLC